MIATRLSRTILRGLLGGGALCMAFSLSVAAQVQTQKTETQGATTKTVTVERGEIVHIAGNDVVVRMEDGTLRDFDNVSENSTFMVDGKPVGIHNAKVGMKLEKQTIVSSTPRVITTVENVTGNSQTGKWRNSDLQDPEWPEVYNQWRRKGRLGAEEGDAGPSHEGNGGPGNPDFA